MELNEKTKNIIDLASLLSNKYNILATHYLSDDVRRNTKEEVVEFLRDIATIYNCTITRFDELYKVNLDVLKGQIQLIDLDNSKIKQAKPLVSNHHFVDDFDKNIISILNYLEILEPGQEVDMVENILKYKKSISDMESKYEVKLREFDILISPDSSVIIDMYVAFNIIMSKKLFESNKIYDELDRSIISKIYEVNLFNYIDCIALSEMEIKENKAFHLKLAYRNNKMSMESIIKLSESVNDIIRYLCAMDRFIETDRCAPVTTKLAYQKIKNLKLTRPARRAIIDKIEELCKDKLVFVQNDFFENESVMKLLASKIHPYEYERKLKCSISIRKVWDKLINNKLVNTYNSSIEKYIKESNLVELLKTIRGTDLIRRINKIVDLCDDSSKLKLLTDSIDSGDTTLKNYIQAYQCIMSRYNSYMRKEKQIQMTNIFKTDRDEFRFRELSIPKNINVIDSVSHSLKKRIMSKCELLVSLGLPNVINEIDEKLSSGSVDKFKLYINHNLNNRTLPMGNRFKSISFDDNNRFSTEITNRNKLRAFTHWIGEDLDLHCLLLDDKCNVVQNVYFGNKTLYVDGKKAVIHSGDVRYAPAPNGANEYVDIDLDLIRQSNVKHIIISNSAYSSELLCDFKECYSGITTYDPNDIDKFITEDITFKTNITSKSSVVGSILINIHPEYAELISIDMSVPDARHAYIEKMAEFTSNLVKYATTYSFFTMYDLIHYGIEGIFGNDIEIVNDENEAHLSLNTFIESSLLEEYLGK